MEIVENSISMEICIVERFIAVQFSRQKVTQRSRSRHQHISLISYLENALKFSHTNFRLAECVNLTQFRIQLQKSNGWMSCQGQEIATDERSHEIAGKPHIVLTVGITHFLVIQTMHAYFENERVSEYGLTSHSKHNTVGHFRDQSFRQSTALALTTK